jgi:hypothetical protein
MPDNEEDYSQKPEEPVDILANSSFCDKMFRGSVKEYGRRDVTKPARRFMLVLQRKKTQFHGSFSAMAPPFSINLYLLLKLRPSQRRGNQRRNQWIHLPSGGG